MTNRKLLVPASERGARALTLTARQLRALEEGNRRIIEGNRRIAELLTELLTLQQGGRS